LRGASKRRKTAGLLYESLVEGHAEEAAAILVSLHLKGAGVALLAYALFAEAARSCWREGAVERLISEATRAVGAEGMIGGQALGLELRAGCADADTRRGAT
jgi:hypothetical protein